MPEYAKNSLKQHKLEALKDKQNLKDTSRGAKAYKRKHPNENSNFYVKGLYSGYRKYFSGANYKQKPIKAIYSSTKF